MNWREEIGSSDGIRTIKKEWMIMSNLAKLALTKGGIIPGNHADRGLNPILEDHIDTEIVHARGGVAPTKSFSFTGVEKKKTPLPFIKTC